MATAVLILDEIIALFAAKYMTTLLMALPIVHLIHCCPLLPVICCTSVMRALLGTNEVEVKRKGPELSAQWGVD